MMLHVDGGTNVRGTFQAKGAFRFELHQSRTKAEAGILLNDVDESYLKR